MGLTYHFSFTAPASVTAGHLAAFLRNVEGDARLMGFDPTVVVNAPFDTPERRDFSRRTARGLLVEDARLRDVELPPETCWNFGPGTGYCRLAPEHGVLLVVTDREGRETVFGFFRYPRVIRDRAGREIMPVPGEGEWVSGNFVNSPDHRYRAIVRRFAEAGYVSSEIDEFAAASPGLRNSAGTRFMPRQSRAEHYAPDMPTLMQQTIGRAVRGTAPGTAKRMRALAKVRWVLATDDGWFVTVDDRACASLTSEAAHATIYDGRDNEALKLRFMETLLGVPLTVVLLDE